LAYTSPAESGLRDAAASENKTLPIHRWVPWIAGFSAKFVQDVMSTYMPSRSRRQHLVLDPFAGVGTTLIEAIKSGHDAIGYEVNPFAALVSRAKVNSIEVHPEDLRAEADAFKLALRRFETEVDRAWDSDPNQDLLEAHPHLRALRPTDFRSRIPFFSPPVEAKFLYALARAQVMLEPDKNLLLAALGATMVSFSNYSYEPSLASRPGAGKPLIENASVAGAVCRKLGEMLTDIEWAQQNYGYQWASSKRDVIEGSYFDSTLSRGEVTLVVTSPPYMNNYHYVRNTRPQLYWLGLIQNGGSRHLEEESFGKFWQTVRQGPDLSLEFQSAEIEQKLRVLRGKNTAKGVYGGGGWANYVVAYLNDTHRFLAEVRQQLRPGGTAVIVLGNSIIQGIEFKVDQLVATIGQMQGLKAEAIHIVRTKRTGNSIIDSSVRNGDANGHRTKTTLYDAAVILRR
jgi:DNA modification methylase